MLYGKGDASCHTYSEQGRRNHDNIKWETRNRCEHYAQLGKKGPRCFVTNSRCDQKDGDPTCCKLIRKKIDS